MRHLIKWVGMFCLLLLWHWHDLGLLRAEVVTGGKCNEPLWPIQPSVHRTSGSSFRGGGGKLCHFFCFKAPSRRTIVFTCLRLCQVKIYKFGHIMCNSWFYGTAVELTVCCWKKKLKWHNLPQPWGKLCHCKGQVVSVCHVKISLCNCSESEK